MPFIRYTDNSMSDVEYESVQFNDLTSCYTYNPLYTAISKNTIGEKDENNFMQWIAPNEVVKFAKSDYDGYLDIIWIKDRPAYGGSEGTSIIPADGTIDVITKMELQKYRFVIDKIVTTLTDDGISITSYDRDAQTYTELLDNERIDGCSFYWENIENGKRLETISPVIRYVDENGEQLLFYPHIITTITSFSTDQSNGQTLSSRVAHSSTNTIYLSLLDIDKKYNYPGVGAQYNTTDDNTDIAYMWYNRNQSQTVIYPTTSYEKFLEALALLGVYFRIGGVDYLGFMDESGQTTGEYLTEADWQKSSQWDSDTINNYTEHKPPYVPEPSEDDYPNLSLDTIGATGLATGVSWFVMSEADMSTLSKLGVYHADPNIIETPWETINKANAVSKAAEDAIISILQFPYDVYRMHSAEGRHGSIRVYIPGIFNSDSEWFGATECHTGAQGGYITDLNRIINAGSVTIPTRQGKATFLDFEPYTSLQMYVPFAGWVSLPCSQCMNATVALQYVIDPPTGSGRAFISANGCVIRDIPFTIGNITPTSVHQTGPLMGPLMNTAFGVAGAIAGAAVAAETGGLSATVGTSMAVGAVSNLSNTLMDSCVPKTQTIGTNGTAITAFPTPKTPVILINRPRIKIPDNMGHRYGYACDKEAVLSSLSGMTVCSNVDTSGINATANEKTRLKAILESGFYA